MFENKIVIFFSQTDNEIVLHNFIYFLCMHDAFWYDLINKNKKERVMSIYIDYDSQVQIVVESVSQSLSSYRCV
jgi:hypothetical protein